MIPEILSVDQVNGEIRIKCDPELARELTFVLSSLIDVARLMRSKIRHVNACQNNQADLDKRLSDFNEKSNHIFSRFVIHLNGVCNGDRAAAIQRIKNEFNLGYGEAKIYITQGSKLNRIKKNKKGENNAG